MADDTPTVEQTRQALIAAIEINAAHVRGDGAFPTLIPDAQIDALIATVRAEQTPEVQRLTAELHAMGDNRDHYQQQCFRLSEELTAVRAENADAWVKAMANEVEVLRTEVVRLTKEVQQHIDQTFDRADKQR